MILKGLKFLLGQTGLTAGSAHSALVLVAPETPGYYQPQSADALTTTPVRQRYLQQVWEHCALPAALYQQLYFAPLAQLLLRVQNVPAAPSGPWSGEGGYGDMVVKYVTCAVRLAKAHLLPADEPPEVQAVQGILWHAVVYWSALYYHLPLLTQYRGEVLSGAPWIPGMSEPGEPYRVEYNPLPSARQTRSFATLLACQLLPSSATCWLSTVPAALDCLTQRLNGLPSTMTEIDMLLETAAEKSGAVLIPCRRPAVSQDVMASPAVGVNGADATSDCHAGPKILRGADVRGAERPPERMVSPGDTLEPRDASVSHLTPDIREGRLEDRRGVPPGPPGDGVLPEADAEDQGEAFWQWLREGLRCGSLPVNSQEGGPQLVGGYLLIPVPGTFFRFLKHSGHEGNDRDDVQRAFERLRYHKRRERRRFYAGRLYSSGDGRGAFRRIQGYLVKASLLFDEAPPDSPYLVIV
jgi:integrating conjugative element relaxase (TIGR03760 family)